ncbi:MAG: enoyl-CoA hydratase-related protein [Aeromicrobium sp.]|uniref:enoyl-CoA hydratase-related protein n=1 Tax=Aeromicrobium sp. TaxID=1871063 RepID=UPI0039E2BA43
MSDLTPGTRSGEDVGWRNVGGVLTLWLRRPDSLNSINADLLDDLADLVEGAAATDARVIALRAEGRGFCSGADLESVEDDDDHATLHAGERLVRAMVATPLPVVTAVQGPCAGMGVPIALAADLTLASDAAFFMLAFTKIGLMPDGGATALVAASVGRATAMRMALLAERLSADEAHTQGLIATVTRSDAFEDHVTTTVDRLAHGPSAAFAHTKAAVNAVTLGAFDRGFVLERKGQLGLLAADDFAEGVTAFREKRRPVFGDR